MRQVVAWGAWVIILTAVVGCGLPREAGDVGQASARDGEPIKVAFVTNNVSDFWTYAQAGTAQAAAELGCTVDFRKPANGTVQEQQQIVEDVIARGVSGIAISPQDPANQTDMLNDAAAQVNLITQDSDAPNSKRLCYIGTNNYDAGVEAGKLIIEALPQGGKIMLFVGSLDAQNAQDRKRGIEDTIQGANITIIDTRTDETDRLKAVANVQDTLVKYPDVAALVGLWSYNGPMILNGVRDSGKLGQVKIIAFDEEPETIQGVKDGHIVGSIVQQPFKFGYDSVKLLVSLAKGDRSVIPDNKLIYLPVRTIRQADAEAFQQELAGYQSVVKALKTK